MYRYTVTQKTVLFLIQTGVLTRPKVYSSVQP